MIQKAINGIGSQNIVSHDNTYIFLDVLLSKQRSNNNECSSITSVFRKKTYAGLLTNYFSFTPFQYKLGLIKTLIDRAYKINNTTQGFQNDINTLTTILKRNMFPSWLIDKSVQGYLRNVTTKEVPKHDVSNCHVYKLPYIGFYSSYTRKKISSIINKYCKDLNVKVIFSPFKLCNIFSPKDFIPDSLKSCVVYKFTCAGFGARYVGETNRHFYTRVNEHLFRDKILIFSSILVFLKIVTIIVMFLASKLLIMLLLSINSKSKRASILSG